MGRRQQVVASESHALIQKPALAVVERSDGPAWTADADELAAMRTARIREEAYRLYEARGQVDGYALDDWLAAEAAVARESAAGARQRRGGTARA
jgi:hypothetical protein